MHQVSYNFHFIDSIIKIFNIVFSPYAQKVGVVLDVHPVG